MGWFDKQVRQRMKNDQEVFEDAFFRIAGSVLGNQTENPMLDERTVTKEALEGILRYYHCKMPEIPESITDPLDQMEYVLRPLGLMTRNVSLTEGWYRDAYGPMLGFFRESGRAVALLPGAVFGYWYLDPETGRKIRINRRNVSMFDLEALCFYRPLPMKKLGIPDLLLYMRRSLSNNDLILIILATLVVTLVTFIEPAVYNVITGPVLAYKSTTLLLGMAVCLVSSSLATSLCNAVKTLMMDRIGNKASLAVDAAVMMRILSLPVSFFRKFSSGDLATRTSSVNSLCTMMLNEILSTGLTSLMSLLYITQIFNYTPALVGPALILILSTVAVNTIASLMRVSISRKKMQIEAKEAGVSFAMLSGVQKIKLSGSEKRAFARWANVYSKGAELDYNPPTFIKVSAVIQKGITLVGTVVLYYLAVKSGVAANNYVAFNVTYGKVMSAFTALAGIALSVARIPPILEMAEPILKTEPEVTEEKEVVTQVSGSIEISHVSFRYEENTPYVLDDLSLNIRSGEYVAIVGRTGCGKSTLVRLLLGFEKPEKGAIYYDGRDMDSVDPRSLRKMMGVVTQNGQLFQGDIYSNIVISAPHLTLDDAWEAAEIAGIADDIREMPMGMNTVISEGQGGVSGGQKQRLMIARAIAPKPKILIFDVATIAVDNRTQKQVSESLDSLNCTRIIIAHRLSTIRNCDRILVLDKGRILESGTYDELIERNGMFAELVARQRLDISTPSPQEEPEA